MRRRVTVTILVLAGLSATVIVLTSRGGRDATRDVAGEIGIIDDPPYAIRLDGPLWRNRTLTGEDGTQDVAQVASDAPLDVHVGGGPHVAHVELRVDGRSQRTVSPRCCARRVDLRFVPRLRTLPPGDHRIQVIARDSRAGKPGADTGAHQTVRQFRVRTVLALPAVTESRPTANTPDAPPIPADGGPLGRAALGIVAAERRNGTLPRGLGSAQLTLTQVGSLNVRGQPLGATLLVSFVPPVQNLRATVPSYLPTAPGAARPYSDQVVKLHVTVLRDALIDVDLGAGRVISFEPGPGSRTASWSESRAPAPAGAADED
jgi:hypothetical protein